MKSVSVSAVVCTLLVCMSSCFEFNLRDPMTTTPGLSGSWNFDHFEDFKGPIVNDIVGLVNNLTIGDIDINDGKDGYLRNIKLKIKASPDSLTVEGNEETNSVRI